MADLLRISILGSMPGGEKWSVNPVYAPTAPLAISTAECAAIALAIDGITVEPTLRSLNVPAVTVDGVRVEARNLDGSLEAVSEHTRTSPVAGTSAASHPYQTAMVCSLRTPDSTARGKGRLYWPATGATISPSTLRVASSSVTDYLNGMNAYLANVRLAIRGVAGLTTATLRVWSRTSSQLQVVTSLRVGDVADVQRRRRDALVESYSSAAVAP